MYYKAQEAMFKLFTNSYCQIRKNNFKRISQKKEEGNHHFFKELEPRSLIELDKEYTARELLNLLRARSFSPHPGCRFLDNGKTFEVRISINEIIDD